MRTSNSNLITPARGTTRRDLTNLLGGLALVIAIGAGSLAAQSSPRFERADTEAAVSLHRHGFEPAQLSLIAGKQSIVVYNRTGLPEIDLEVQRTNGQGRALGTVKRERAPWTRKSWNGALDLPVGEYQIREVNHPDWVLQLTIRPRGRR